jgi:hypothetical protein
MSDFRFIKVTVISDKKMRDISIGNIRLNLSKRALRSREGFLRYEAMTIGGFFAIFYLTRGSGFADTTRVRGEYKSRLLYLPHLRG